MVVSYDDIYGSLNTTVSVSTTSTQLSATRLGLGRRKSITIVPLTAAVTVTISKGDSPAVANQGLVLTANQPYAEADDSAYPCWQGAWQIVATGSGSVAVQEVFER